MKQEENNNEETAKGVMAIISVIGMIYVLWLLWC